MNIANSIYSAETYNAISRWETHCCNDFEDKITLTTVKSESTLQSLTALSVGEAAFYAVVKGCQVGLYLRSMYMDLGIRMKVEIQMTVPQRTL